MTKNMKTYGLTAALVAALVAHGQAASPPAGYVTVDVPGNSDALVSVPFNQATEFSGAVSAVAGNVITVSGSPFVAGAYNNGLYFVRFTSGTRDGQYTTVTANTANTLTVEDASSVAAGNTFVLYPHQTLGSVFTSALAGTAYITSPSAFSIKTQVLVPNLTGSGINKSASATYYHLTGAWRKVGASTSSNFNDTVLLPDSYVMLRNAGNATPLMYVANGAPELDALAKTLATLSSANDIYCVSGRPVPMTLAQLGLGGTAAFKTTTSTFSIQDTLQVFENPAGGINKSASATYYYFNSAWRKVGQPTTTSFDNELAIKPGEGFVIRKVGGTPAAAVWTENAPY
jgi:uncharacterized protein (TIGR02597 family)